MRADPLTVARYLSVRAGSGASIATLRLAAIAKAHEPPCRDRGVREALKGWCRRLARPQRQAPAPLPPTCSPSYASPPPSPVAAAAALRRPSGR